MSYRWYCIGRKFIPNTYTGIRMVIYSFFFTLLCMINTVEGLWKMAQSIVRIGRYSSPNPWLILGQMYTSITSNIPKVMSILIPRFGIILSSKLHQTFWLTILNCQVAYIASQFRIWSRSFDLVNSSSSYFSLLMVNYSQSFLRQSKTLQKFYNYVFTREIEK